MMKFAICNEIFEPIEFNEICQIVSKIGYKGIEIAPFTFADDVKKITQQQRELIRQTAKNAGLTIIAMHWLLKSPAGMSITSPDERTFEQTKNYFKSLVDFAHDIKTPTLVFGSPNQRYIEEGWNKEAAINRAETLLKEVSRYAYQIDPRITIAFEPLSSSVTNFGDSVESAIEIIKKIDEPNFRIHLDAIQLSGEKEIPEIMIDKVISRLGLESIAHVHLNEPNFLGPGMLNEDYKSKIDFNESINTFHTSICDRILQKLKASGYNGWYSVEAFETPVPAINIAEKSFKFMEKIWQSG